MMMTLCRRKVHNQQAATPPLKAATPRSLAPSLPLLLLLSCGCEKRKLYSFSFSPQWEEEGGKLGSCRRRRGVCQAMSLYVCLCVCTGVGVCVCSDCLLFLISLQENERSSQGRRRSGSGSGRECQASWARK